jgi:CRISPR/Cas system-associated protein Cas10 (large subunit of type III CRISPR-Cas system)
MTENMVNEDLLKVRFCALLHDIGKPLCWALKKSWSHHVEFGLNILEDTFGKEIAKLAVSHHTTESYADYFHPGTKIERTISVADHIASGADRHIDEDPTYGGAIPSLPVVMEQVLSNKKAVYLTQAEELISFTEEFKKRFKGASIDNDTFNQVFDWLARPESVLKRIPADTRHPYNDVSLFDHLRLSCAIANCIWSQGYRNEKKDSYTFSVISADADKISAYINRSSRLPDLRAGSLLISEATNKASSLVKQLLGPECIIFEGGGGFLALSNNQVAANILEQVKTEFENATFNDTSMSVASISVSGSDIQRNFAQVWGKAIKAMHDKKVARGEAGVMPMLVEGKPLCDICKIRSAEPEDQEPRPLLVNTLPSFENICKTCKKRRGYGRTGTSIDSIADSNHLVAVLKIDGDDMGEIISGRRVEQEFKKHPTPSRISTISRLVHEACGARLGDIVTQNGGLTIYSGGDDVLAVLPGNKVFNTAMQMQESFSDIMGGDGSVSMSAGIAIFNYKIPIYIGLNAASECLKIAKNNEDKASVSFDVLFGVSANTVTTKRPYKWSEFKRLLEVVDYMNSKTSTAISQIRAIVERERKATKRIEAQLLVKYNMGRQVLEWDEGQYFLECLNKGILTDGFIIYNIIRKKREDEKEGGG